MKAGELTPSKLLKDAMGAENQPFRLFFTKFSKKTTFLVLFIKYAVHLPNSTYQFMLRK